MHGAEEGILQLDIDDGIDVPEENGEGQGKHNHARRNAAGQDLPLCIRAVGRGIFAGRPNETWDRYLVYHVSS